MAGIQLVTRPCSSRVPTQSANRYCSALLNNLLLLGISTWSAHRTCGQATLRFRVCLRVLTLAGLYLTACASLQLPRRLARRLLDLQSLPHIVVTNPYITQVYKAYHRAFRILNGLPPISSLEDNRNFTTLLEQLLEEHSKFPLVSSSSAPSCHALCLPPHLKPTPLP